MLVANGNDWHFGHDVTISQTHQTVKRNLGSGEYSDDIYGSKIITSEGTTSITINNPKEPNIEMSLVNILKLHKQQCDYFAIATPGEYSPIPQTLTQILVYLGEEPHSNVRNWSPIVFVDGSWERWENDYRFTLERKCIGSGWYTRITATKEHSAFRPNNSSEFLATRSDSRTLFSSGPAPVHFDNVKRLFDL